MTTSHFEKGGGRKPSLVDMFLDNNPRAKALFERRKCDTCENMRCAIEYPRRRPGERKAKTCRDCLKRGRERLDREAKQIQRASGEAPSPGRGRSDQLRRLYNHPGTGNAYSAKGRDAARRERLRAEIPGQIEAFLKAGGEITVVPSGASGLDYSSKTGKRAAFVINTRRDPPKKGERYPQRTEKTSNWNARSERERMKG